MATQDSNTVGAYDAKLRFPELLDLVERGEEFTITKDGSPVAKLVPIKRPMTPAERGTAIERWKESRKDIQPLGMNIKDVVNEGRP